MSKVMLWKDAYTIKMRDRRIVVRRMENNDWLLNFRILQKGEVEKDHYNKVISHGQNHICMTVLRLSNEAMENIVVGYANFLREHAKIK